MALSYVESYGTGSQVNFPYSSISLLDDDLVSISSQLRVFIDGTQQTVGVDYSVNTTTQNVVFVSAPLSTQLVRVARYTKDDERYINYTNSTNITADILNTDAEQIFFLAQEAKDLQNDAMTVGPDGKWNAQSRIIGYVATGIDGTDAVNVAQLQAAVLGTTPAALGGHGYQSFTGDGTTTSFLLPTQIATITSPEDIQVFISGVYQTPNNAYTITGGNIVFSPAPVNNAKIEVLWLQGVLSGILGADSVDTAAIINKAVTAPKIGSLSAVVDTVLKADGAGGTSFGTIPASTVSNFDTQVRTNRLDQMATPLASVSMGSQKITNLANPTSANDAVNLTYLNSNIGDYDKTVSLVLGHDNSTGVGTAVTQRDGTNAGNNYWRGGTLTYAFNTQPGSVTMMLPITFATPSGTVPNQTFTQLVNRYIPFSIPLSSYPAMTNNRRVVVLIHDGVASSQSICFLSVAWANPSGNTIEFEIELTSPADSAQNRRPYFVSGSEAVTMAWTRKNTV